MRFPPVCLSFFLVLLASAGQAHEEEAAAEDTGPWSGNVSLGYLATSGNTDNSNVNGGFGVAYETGKWKHGFDAYLINAKDADATTAESYGAAWRTEYSLTDPNFLFGLLDYRRDRFSGYPTQFSQSIGYGRRLIATTAHTLNGDIGLGARQSERSDGVDENDFIIRGGLAYQWQFSETAEFTQDLVIEYGDLNTYLESVTAVRARLAGDLALVASYTIKHNSDVAIGTESTDTYSALSLEYAF